MNTKIKTQVLILGAGPGGYSAAFRCADLGMKTAIVEQYPNLGGVCLNVGCIPSKALLHIAKLIKSNNSLQNYGFYTEPQHFNINTEKICSWKNKIITNLSNNLYTMAKNKNIKIVHGFGQFIDDKTVTIISNQKETIEIIFNYAIIATGSYPKSLLSLPKDERIWNSTNALSLKIIPNNLLIIGSGAIGLEMATIYSAFGSKVDLLETYNQIMPIIDIDIMRIFCKNIHKNINIFTNTQINEIHPKKDGIYVFTKNSNSNIQNNSKRYDAILIAIGRSPNSNNLNLKNIKVNVDKNGFIMVDKQMRTNNSNIFAIGDVIGTPMLAHKSIHEGNIVAEVLFGKKCYFDAKVIPSIVYSDPEIAWVGYTEKEAKLKKLNYQSVIFPWTSLGKAIAENCTVGITKLLFDKQTHRIIGGTILGSNAGEIIGEIALAIEMGSDVEDIALTIHAHPTLYESINYAALKHAHTLTYK